MSYDASYDAVEGESTLFSGPSFAPDTTYIVDDRSDGGLCWVWGDDPSYYADYSKACIRL